MPVHAQVHGIVHDTIDFVENILVTEMNSATDNPMIFSGCVYDELNGTRRAAGILFDRCYLFLLYCTVSYTAYVDR